MYNSKLAAKRRFDLNSPKLTQKYTCTYDGPQGNISRGVGEMERRWPLERTWYMNTVSSTPTYIPEKCEPVRVAPMPASSSVAHECDEVSAPADTPFV